MSHEARSFDWETAKARLESTTRMLGSGLSDVEQLLEERARRYARRPTSDGGRVEVEELLEFACRDQTFAIELRFAKSVAVALRLTPLPAVPPWLVGVIHHQSAVVPVFDASLLMGAEVAGDGVYVVIAEVEGSTFGLRAESVRGVVSVASNAISAPPPAAGAHTRFIRGVTENMTALIDLEALAHDPRVVVEETAQ